MLDGRVLEASQVEYEPFGKTPLKREVSLLTGEIGQIKLIHIRKKTLVRAWCGPGAGLVRAWCGFQDRSRGAGLALRNLLMAGVRTEWYSTALAAGIEPRAE